MTSVEFCQLVAKRLLRPNREVDVMAVAGAMDSAEKAPGARVWISGAAAFMVFHEADGGTFTVDREPLGTFNRQTGSAT